MKKLSLIALGGSLIVPNKGEINVLFLKKFKKFILRFVKNGWRFIIVAGGGTTARIYQKSAEEIGKLSFEDADWIGIHATRLNAHLLRTVFRQFACPVVIDDPTKEDPRIKISKYPIFIASGWKPGWSTDYIAVLLAKRFKVKRILDAGNIPYVFNKDYKKYKEAKPIFKISWQNYQKLIGSEWIPGMSVPFDPIAAKEARLLDIEAIVFSGDDFRNFKKILEDKPYQGTFIDNH